MADFAIAPILVDADRARTYVLAHGGLRERARLDGIWGGAKPPKEVVKELEALQNPDGGFPLFQQPGAPSAVDTSLFILAQLKDMPPLAGSPMASRAVSFVRRMQKPDGSWAEPEALAGQLPPWSSPENPQAAPYLTANAMFTSLTLSPSYTDPAIRAERWLLPRLAEMGGQVPVQTLGLASAALFKLHGGFTEPFWPLWDGVVRAEATASQLAWVLSAYLEVGVGGRAMLPLVRLLGALAERQGEDGAWEGNVETTLQALRVLRGYGVI